MVVLQGDKPADGTSVYVLPIPVAEVSPRSITDHAAIGIWKDRTDLPDDPANASKPCANA